MIRCTARVNKLQGIDPPEYRLRVGDYRARFKLDGETIRILRVRNRREAPPLNGQRASAAYPAGCGAPAKGTDR
jgi:ParE toxin of type II toxin-antitoxin system, parDE